MTPAARLAAVLELGRQLEPQLAGAGPRGLSSPPADALVSGYFRGRRYIGAKDRGAIADRVYGLLRRRAALDWWVARTQGVAGDDDPNRARLIADLILTDRRDPDDLGDLFSGARFAPDPMSGEERALARGLKGHTLDHPDQPLAVRGAFPAWLAGDLNGAFGEAVEAEMAALIPGAPLDLRVNGLRAQDRGAVQARLAREGLRTVPTPLSPLGLRAADRAALPTLPAFREGLVEVQDEGSQLVALLTGAAPGMRVCDFCAGAGGKTLALAASMENRGRIVACDVSEGRSRRMTDRLRRAGVQNVDRRLLRDERDQWVKRQAWKGGRGGFERVLVDAPCTGTGTWRRNPDARWRLRPGDLDALTALQGRILDSAARLVRPGGRLIHATCSMLAAENDERIAAFLKRDTRFRLVPVRDLWADLVGTAPPAGAAETLTLTPRRDGTDGFYCAVLERDAT